MFGVCVLRHAEKTWKNLCVDSKTPPFVDSKRPRVYVPNVLACTGTTRTCVSTCARGARTHGDVLNVYMGVIASSAYQNLPTLGEVHQRNFWIFTIFKFEKRLRTSCP